VSGYRVVPIVPPGLRARALAVAAAIAFVGVWAGFILAGLADAREARLLRHACDAQGGIVVRLESGRACLWAGAVIPITPQAAAVYSARPPGEPTDRSPTR
jgi:hypothetical protein